MTAQRIAALDVLRGIAILGTLGTNIWIFTDPLGAAGFLATPSPDTAGGFTEIVLRLLANGKFLALLSILFGVGLEIQYRSARKRGARWPGWYLWRSALLLVEGLVHYVLIFEFDVLMYYAVVSILVAFLVSRSERVLRAWLIGTAVLYVGAISLLTYTRSTGQAGPIPTPSTSDWLTGVADRLTMAGTYRAEAFLVIPLSFVLFLAGSLLMRAGALEDSARGRRIQLKLAKFGLGLGIPLDLLAGFSGGNWFFAERYLAAPVVALGLLGLITRLVHRMRQEPGLIRTGLTSIGRTALSCYVTQNLLAGAFCYGWGLGLAATLNDARPWWVAGFYVFLCALLMTLATWWSRRFSRGPVELAWQWAYLAPQRKKAVTPAS
ncbi:DUF418 domain-containing protein [Amycolatopsis sp. H20-H5]|uniref:DUF418 domain-containing protein n=1 Tax=Amycolatopsis sp. H20-H5 TaxID=3046309 RepID=UPI002DBF9E0F|nr:DUF418 domain-containing protein [Amycolatopsis sp. H20-H5]MEC3975108.1 DUF418 domain-containing protein [Amycolatopsis sp. H20-H5]